MPNDKIQQILTVAHLYFEKELSQDQIAKQLNISRPTVSRLLKTAKEEGFVRIQIMDPLADSRNLAERLQQKYELTEVHVVPTVDVSVRARLEAIGAFTAQYLERVVHDGDIIGIGWGKTIHSISAHLEHQVNVKDVQVVQLKGSSTKSGERTYAFESINQFANAFKTVPQYLPLPVVFEQKTTKQQVEQDKYIHDLIQLGQRANIAVFTVGTVRDSALAFQLDFFSKPEMDYLQSHAVGDVFSRFIDVDGQIVSKEINDRTVGIQLDDLRTKERSILVATGTAKVIAVDAALRGRYANTLIIDQTAAQQLAVR